jgi:hypothetical protein
LEIKKLNKKMPSSPKIPMVRTISFVGSRGIPATYGGFETFVEEISYKLANKNDLRIIIVCDYSNSTINLPDNIVCIRSRYDKSVNPISFYFNSVYLGLKHSDIIFVLGSFGSLFYFLNLYYGRIIVTNTDGLEHRREKWSFIGRIFLKLLERLSVLQSNYVICDSIEISNYMRAEYNSSYHKKYRVIEYGATDNSSRVSQSVLSEYKLSPFEYYIIVARIEPENHILEKIEGYLKSGSSKKLLLVGNVPQNNYGREVSALIKNSTDIISPGGIYNRDKLFSLRYYAFVYLHGHSVGGTNPSLLEALSASNICICHDNVFNREVTDDSMYYFANTSEISKNINLVESLEISELIKYRDNAKSIINKRYTWDKIESKYWDFINSLPIDRKNTII